MFNMHSLTQVSLIVIIIICLVVIFQTLFRAIKAHHQAWEEHKLIAARKQLLDEGLHLNMEKLRKGDYKLSHTPIDTTKSPMLKGIKHTYKPGQLFEIDGQAFDGFAIKIENSDELDGVYAFTHFYDYDMALFTILAGDAIPHSENHFVNT